MDILPYCITLMNIKLSIVDVGNNEGRISTQTMGYARPQIVDSNCLVMLCILLEHDNSLLPRQISKCYV